MFKKVFALVLTSSLINVVSAASLSSAITLASGSIEPTKNLTFSLEKLISGIVYDVTCKISNPNAEIVTIGFTGPYMYYNVSLNDARMDRQGNLQIGNNTLFIGSVHRSTSDSFTITNADQTNVIDVSSCEAVAE